jgi:hypothetical protein
VIPTFGRQVKTTRVIEISQTALDHNFAECSHLQFECLPDRGVTRGHSFAFDIHPARLASTLRSSRAT